MPDNAPPSLLTQQSFARLTTPESLAQWLCIAAIIVIAMLAGHWARNSARRRAPPSLPWHATALEGLVVLAPALCALALLLPLHALFAARGAPLAPLDLALRLSVVAVLVRSAIFLVGLLV